MMGAMVGVSCVLKMPAKVWGSAVLALLLHRYLDDRIQFDMLASMAGCGTRWSTAILSGMPCLLCAKTRQTDGCFTARECMGQNVHCATMYDILAMAEKLKLQTHCGLEVRR